MYQDTESLNSKRLAEHTLALAGRQHQVVLRVVEAIGGGERNEVVGIARAVRIELAIRRGDADRLAGVRIGEHEATVGRRRRTEGETRAGLGHARMFVLGGADAVLFGQAGRQEEAVAIAAAAEGHFAGLGCATGFELAVIDRGGSAIELASRNDVDHTRNGVRTVDRRGAVFQHLDALDDRHRNGVQVGRTGNAGSRGFIDPAQSVDQHQHAL